MKIGQKYKVISTSVQFDKDEIVIYKRRSSNNKYMCIVERSNKEDYAIFIDNLEPIERMPV